MVNQFEKSKICYNRNVSYIPLFPKKIFDSVLDSKIFIYPQLLPKKPFKSDVGHNRNTIISSEE